MSPRAQALPDAPRGWRANSRPRQPSVLIFQLRLDIWINVEYLDFENTGQAKTNLFGSNWAQEPV